MAKFKRVPLDSVVAGSVLNAPIADPANSGVKLLTAGIPITEEFIQKLRSRGISEVVISQRDLATMHAFNSRGRARQVPAAPTYVQSILVNDATKNIDQQVHDGRPMSFGEITEPLSAVIQRPTDCVYPTGLQQEWAGSQDTQIDAIGSFYEDTDERGSSVATLRETCESILKRIGDDLDALVCLAGSPAESEYPSRHSIHLASMAMAIGVESDLDHAHLIDLGMGCLIHDIGMQQVGITQFQSKQKITNTALQKLADHPVLSIQVAAKFGSELSDHAKMVAYQIHERLDGSGYPRGRKADQIHQLAKIAAVADVFVALTAPRPHRLGIQGYYAIKQILEDVKMGKLDPHAVRSLLQATSLFPIGSFVELTNDHIGRVIRTGGSNFDKPTIEMWAADGLDGKPTVINLKNETSIQIRAAIASPKVA
ncbi:MAG: HD-GYP domain-containing protein [Rubripirellula sp.]